MAEIVGKIYKVFDDEVGVIIDDKGIFYYYDSSEFTKPFTVSVGDIVTFKVVQKVVSGYSYYKALYISKQTENSLYISK